jgi:hypothetical protein
VPHKEVDPNRIPDWVGQIEDDCLASLMMEVLVARHKAIEDGANHKLACRGHFRSAEATLEQLQYGRLKGRDAWKKASDALRKYSVARECAHPTSRRHLIRGAA